MGAGKVTSYPAHKAADIAAEARKRSARTPVKHTPNARLRARARTEEWFDFLSDRVTGVSGGSSIVTSGHSSGTSSRLILRTRSGRVPKCVLIYGERTNVKRRGPPPVQGRQTCECTAVWDMGGKDPVKIAEEE